MITASLPKIFPNAPYKALPTYKWRIVKERPELKYPRVVVELTQKQYENMSESDIEALFEIEYDRIAEQLENTLDFSKEEDENTYSTFIMKGDRPDRQYLFIQG
jgi:hypothetical protein